MHFEPYDQNKHFKILQKWYSTPENLMSMGLDPMSEAQLKEWLNTPDRIHLIFYDQNDAVGCVNFYHYKTTSPVYEIGYLVDSKFRGKGFATRMVEMALSYAKENLGIEKIDETYVLDSNLASKIVLEKNGFDKIRYDKNKGRNYFSKIL